MDKEGARDTKGGSETQSEKARDTEREGNDGLGRHGIRHGNRKGRRDTEEDTCMTLFIFKREETKMLTVHFLKFIKLLKVQVF